METISLHDGREIQYELTRKRVKNVNMRVKEDGVVYVSANTNVSVKRIEEILTERADFILSAVERIRSREQRSEITTEKMRYLGSEYPVRVIRNSRETVELAQDEIRVLTNHPEAAERMLYQWTADRLIEILRELNREVRGALAEKGLFPPLTTITIKDMKSRWGSCSYNRGHISMNLRLAAYPRETILSVLWHEYSHYWHHDHSDKFYTFLTGFYPEYYKWNGLLK